MSSYLRPISNGSRLFAVRFFLGASIFLFGMGHVASPARAQSGGTQIRIDASEPYREPGPASYDEGSANSPAGVTLGLNSRYLTLNG